MINIKQLKYFITCADAGSFSEAASVLYTTQSSVSKVIRSLEEEMQASLLGRPCKYNIYKNIEGKADIPPFQCINSDVQK